MYLYKFEELAKVPVVVIDPRGVFKYILVKINDNIDSKLIIRGFTRCDYHADIMNETLSTLAGNLNATCLGGGRIDHQPDKKTILVYGYSQGFGRADHQKVVDMLNGAFKEYSISYTDDGY